MNKHSIGHGYTPAPRAAYTIAQFCDEHCISRTHLHHLTKAGKGPRLMKLGRRILISAEAAADWRREVESATARSARPLEVA